MTDDLSLQDRQPATEQHAGQSITGLRVRLDELEHLVRRLWDIRASDVAETTALASRTDRIEAGFESIWNMLTRLEVKLADLARHHNDQPASDTVLDRTTVQGSRTGDQQ